MVVLEGLPDPRRRAILNPFTELLVQSLPRDRIEVVHLRLRSAFWRRFDVFHVHWPEQLVRGHWAKRIAKCALTLFLLLRMTVAGTPVVRTIHNLQPHESGWWVEGALLSWLDQLTTAWIVLNDTTPSPDPSRTTVVLHGEYSTWYRPHPDIECTPGSLLVFGQLRRYKGIDEFLKVFKKVPDHGLRVLVAGRPESATFGQQVEAIAASDPRISLSLRFVPDQELADLIAAAELVVLPYRDVENSGSALLALSLKRPVILPSTRSTEQLAREFGNEWVATYEGDLDALQLDGLIARTRAATRSPYGPDLQARRWPELGDQLADVLERAAAAVS
ncbi:GDP-mannose--glycolipid 4-beta-D-mannosyltransferase [Nocardioides ginsengisegetis]